MDLIKLRIPLSFIRDRVSLSWPEVRFGLANELLDPSAPIDLAIEQGTRLEDPPSVLIELAGASKDAPILGLVEQLARGEPEHPDDRVREKWLYLVLAWIHEHRDSCPDPLGTVEEVYADFDYPKQIAGFVRYMPMQGRDLGSKEANQRRLFERWEQFLKEGASAFSSR